MVPQVLADVRAFYVAGIEHKFLILGQRCKSPRAPIFCGKIEA
jgi:hypothetical protein